MSYLITKDVILQDFLEHSPYDMGDIARCKQHGKLELKMRLTNGNIIFYDFISKQYELICESGSLTEEAYKRAFSNRLYRMMRKKGYIQDDLAHLTGLSKARISYYINGKIIPNMYVVSKLAKALGCTVNELTDFD